MRKPDFCLCETKGADQLCSNCTFDIVTRIVQFFVYLFSKFEASSFFLRLYRPVCVGNTGDLVSRVVAHLILGQINLMPIKCYI